MHKGAKDHTRKHNRVLITIDTVWKPGDDDPFPPVQFDKITLCNHSNLQQMSVFMLKNLDLNFLKMR